MTSELPEGWTEGRMELDYTEEEDGKKTDVSLRVDPHFKEFFLHIYEEEENPAPERKDSMNCVLPEAVIRRALQLLEVARACNCQK